MSNPFLHRLEPFVSLSEEEKADIDIMNAWSQNFRSNQQVIRREDRASSIAIVMEGWVCKHRVFTDGRRQIMSLFLPGDICNPYALVLGVTDTDIFAMTHAKISMVPTTIVRQMIARRPVLKQAFWWQTLVALETQRHWTVCLGRRSALERLAHIFCEFDARLSEVGLSNGFDFDMPLTQTDLAEVAGLSPVHVNRCIQYLRDNRIVAISRRRLTIMQKNKLIEIADFDAGYLRPVRSADVKSVHLMSYHFGWLSNIDYPPK